MRRTNISIIVDDPHLIDTTVKDKMERLGIFEYEIVGFQIYNHTAFVIVQWYEDDSTIRG